MEIQDKVSFVAEVSSMMRTKEYKEFIETLQRKETEIHFHGGWRDWLERHSRLLYYYEPRLCRPI